MHTEQFQQTPWRSPVRPFALQYASLGKPTDTVAPYRFDAARQLNVLPDGRPAISDTELLLTAGTTTSTAGSQTHFDD
ncbi:putative ATP-grasp-modified RiPP [Streptomyces sp. B93]|nr:putative ATP-grasp-modified RiPP [Streptomyces sp. B93]